MDTQNQSFFERLNQLQVRANCPKNQYNSFGKYNYRSCEDILEGIKPLIKELGLVVNVSDEIVQVGERIYVKATSTITDGQNSFSAIGYAREQEEKKGMDASQVTGATSSYARKYSLQGLLALDDNKDADATNTHPQNGNNGSGKANNGNGNQNSQSGNGASGNQPQSQNNNSNSLPKIEGIAFEEVYGKDNKLYVLAKGDTYNKKSQLDKLGFKRSKDQNGNWVVFRPKAA